MKQTFCPRAANRPGYFPEGGGLHLQVSPTLTLAEHFSACFNFYRTTAPSAFF
jgi:hypothetical protein